MKHVRPSRNERGATMLEFAITLPVFMFTIVAIMDFTQVLTVQAVLDEAANRALLRATTVPNFDIDPNDLANQSPTSVGYRRLALARQKSVESGMNFVQTVKLVHPEGSTAPTGRMAELLNLRYTEERVPGSTPLTSAMMVLLPGDCAEVVSLSETICNRQSLGIANGAARPSGEPAVLLKNHPIRALAVAQVDGYLPYWGNKLIVGEAFGYRQPIPQGPFPAFEDPELQVAVGPPPGEVVPPILGAGEEPVPSVIIDCANLCVLQTATQLPFQGAQCQMANSATCDCDPDYC